MSERIPLVLLPGLLCDNALWKHQVAALADVADCQVIVMTEDDTMAGMAARILDETPAKFALAGLSMGGYCAFEIMRQAPDRVARLALLDTSPEADAPSRRNERLAWITKAKLNGLEALIPDHMAMWLHPEHLKDEALVAVVVVLFAVLAAPAAPTPHWRPLQAACPMVQRCSEWRPLGLASLPTSPGAASRG